MELTVPEARRLINATLTKPIPLTRDEQFRQCRPLWHGKGRAESEDLR